MPTEPHWTAYVTALLTPVIAVLGTYIAYQQWKINSHKLRLDLFEKRWAIYAATNDMLATLIRGSEDERREAAQNFRRRLIDANFLCSKDTVSFLDKVNLRIASVVDTERAVTKIHQEAPGRKEAELRAASEADGARADYESLVSVFAKDLRINF
jgi:hypothetical protein